MERYIEATITGDELTNPYHGQPPTDLWISEQVDGSNTSLLLTIDGVVDGSSYMNREEYIYQPPPGRIISTNSYAGHNVHSSSSSLPGQQFMNTLPSYNTSQNTSVQQWSSCNPDPYPAPPTFVSQTMQLQPASNTPHFAGSSLAARPSFTSTNGWTTETQPVVEKDCESSCTSPVKPKKPRKPTEKLPAGLKWPSVPLHDLIARAILSSKNERMTIKELYTWFERFSPCFTKDNYKSWRNGIRHKLTILEYFVKLDEMASGRYHYWAISPEYIVQLRNGSVSSLKELSMQEGNSTSSADDRSFDTVYLPPPVEPSAPQNLQVTAPSELSLLPAAAIQFTLDSNDMMETLEDWLNDDDAPIENYTGWDLCSMLDGLDIYNMGESLSHFLHQSFSP